MRDLRGDGVNLDRAYLAVVAGKSFITLRDSRYARITAVGPPLTELYRASLIAADMDAHELKVRTLYGDSHCCDRLSLQVLLAARGA